MSEQEIDPRPASLAFGPLYPDGVDGASFDEPSFLAATEPTGEPAAERLRHLAIWEASERPPQDLAAFRTVEDLYRRAARHAPDAVAVHHSLGLSAAETIDLAPPADREALFGIAGAAYERALALAPDDVDVLFGLGLLHYLHGSLDSAEELLRRALEKDPRSARTLLYLGHARQDRGDWAGALERYARVDRARLAEELQPWRAGKLDELAAVCHLHLGDRDRALALLLPLVEAYERAPAGDLPDDGLELPDELVSAAAGELAPELKARVQAVVERHGWAAYYRRTQPEIFL